ncbi:hypothetical protein D3C76_1097280 [compost metagenome]
MAHLHPQGLPGRETERPTGFHLTGRDGVERPLEQSGGIGRRVEAQRQHGTEPGLLEQRPERPGLEPLELTRPVVDEEDLNEQRGTGEEQHPQLYQLGRHRQASLQHPGHGGRQQHPEQQTKCRELQGDRQTTQQGHEIVLHDQPPYRRV